MNIANPELVKPWVSSSTASGSHSRPSQYSHTTRWPLSQARRRLVSYLSSSWVATSASSDGSEPSPSSSSSWKYSPIGSFGGLATKPMYSAGDSSGLAWNGWKIVNSVRATSVTSVYWKSLNDSAC